MVAIPYGLLIPGIVFVHLCGRHVNLFNAVAVVFVMRIFWPAVIGVGVAPVEGASVVLGCHLSYLLACYTSFIHDHTHRATQNPLAAQNNLRYTSRVRVRSHTSTCNARHWCCRLVNVLQNAPTFSRPRPDTIIPCCISPPAALVLRKRKGARHEQDKSPSLPGDARTASSRIPSRKSRWRVYDAVCPGGCA